MMTLDELGHKYGTDKASPPPDGNHGYCDIYERFFEPMRSKVELLLEIGVWKGASMLMWDEYFHRAAVIGMENFSEAKEMPNFGMDYAVFRGDQANREDLAKVVKGLGLFDIIIDDGGHTMEQQQVSLGYLFKFLKPGGWYVVEDLWTSRWHGTKNRPVGWFNPTGTKHTTLNMLETMNDRRFVLSDFMTDEEQGYIEGCFELVHIEHGVHSEIAFIRKKK